MVPEIELNKYAQFLADEYLKSFISAGGSAVKIAVVHDRDDRDALIDSVVRRAGQRGYATATVDSAATRINLVQQIFWAVAAKLDWAALSRAVVGSLLFGLYGEGVRGAKTVDEIAEFTGIDTALARTAIQKALTEQVLRNYELAKDFRTAMVQLCRTELEPEALMEEGRTAILEWLRGELRLISALKDMQIFHKITRHNARTMLGSAARWVSQAGGPGLVVVLDIGRLSAARHPGAEGAGFYYTPAAVMDAFEVLRQFIDATDEMEHLMILVVAPAELLDGDSKRGFASYQALRNRIWDDVRDRDRANPCAPMVRIKRSRGGD